jgi:peroxiredoxin
MKSIVATAVVFMCVAVPLSAELTKPAARKVAPDFTSRDATGAPIQLSTFRGKVVLLDYWATWCAGCKVEIPWYVEFQHTYQAQGLSAIGVAMDDNGWKSVTPYLKEHPISYPIVTGDADLAKRYGVTALPVTLLIDRTGRIAATHFGLVDKASFERDLRRLLDEKPSR